MDSVNRLTLTMEQDALGFWVGKCHELDLVASGPNHWDVWQDLLNVCRAQMAYAVEHDLTNHLIRGESPS